ncbi:histidinol-phosphate transaminase [Candidatus Persebacteraceae bacterium Df01]|uniref:Histidinol-phosphate aminotransferase n=1 Tax=Candidatus Doriopsillibacter californiensis TaxID=2970740 RepID=A0ABT7QJM8_9GAMM|nr:histidinol-phosphate transaminase [Candidatus Persebacteraceae bacterium Df01]
MPNSVLCHIAESVQTLAPYQPGRPIEEVSREHGITDIIKLASNENPLGPGNVVLQALRELPAAAVARYPDSGSSTLRVALAEKLQVTPECLIFGNGSNEILELAAQLLLTETTAAVYSQHAFVVYKLAVAARRARARVTPAATDYGHDLNAIAEAAQSDDVRLIFVDNPNNPTGNWHSQARIADLLRQVPKHVLVVVDEAYCEYADEEGVLPLLTEYPNLLITRTFSKIHGLASLRVGYGIGDAELIQMFNRVRQPFNVSMPAQVAALAALRDTAHVERSRRLNDAGMRQINDELKKLELPVMPSRGNFLTFSVSNADVVYQQLLAAGVIVRPLAGYDLPEWLRVTIGTETENARFLQALREALNKCAQ